MLIECLEVGIPLKTFDLRTCTASNRTVRLLSDIVVDVRDPVKKESGDLDERRRGSVGVFGEEGGRDEGEDGLMACRHSLGPGTSVIRTMIIIVFDLKMRMSVWMTTRMTRITRHCQRSRKICSIISMSES